MTHQIDFHNNDWYTAKQLYNISGISIRTIYHMYADIRLSLPQGLAWRKDANGVTEVHSNAIPWERIYYIARYNPNHIVGNPSFRDAAEQRKRARRRHGIPMGKKFNMDIHLLYDYNPILEDAKRADRCNDPPTL